MPFIIINCKTNYYMKVVILAAGRGKRMGEFTEEKTKAMLPIYSFTDTSTNPNQKKPMLQITIEQFVACGLNDFIIVVGYRKEDILDYFGDGSRFGATIKYVTQENVCAGTANAVECSKQIFKNERGETFFLVYGDVVPTKNDILNIALRHQASFQNIGVMAVRTVDDPQRYGVVEKDEDDNITRIVEKSMNPPTNLINAGIYILPTKIFEHIEKTKLSERGEYELTDSIQQLINCGTQVKTCEVSGLKDIGTKQIYETYS